MYTNKNLKDSYKKNRDDFLSANPLEDPDISNMYRSVIKGDVFMSGIEHDYLSNVYQESLEKKVLKKQAEKEFKESL